MKIPKTPAFCFWHRTGNLPPRAGAFSIIELLITLALILILFTMLYGFGSRSHQQTQKRACQKNLLNIFIALDIYSRDHEGAFPALASAQTSDQPLALLVPRYTVDTKPFICPGSKDSSLPPGQPLTGRRISYAYFMGWQITNSQAVLMTDEQVDCAPKTAGRAVFSTTGKPPGNNHYKYGGNYLFVDGHAEMSSSTAPFPLAWPGGIVLLNPKQ